MTDKFPTRATPRGSVVEKKAKVVGSGRCDECGWDFTNKHYETMDHDLTKTRAITRDELRFPCLRKPRACAYHHQVR